MNQTENETSPTPNLLDEMAAAMEAVKPATGWNTGAMAETLRLRDKQLFALLAERDALRARLEHSEEMHVIYATERNGLRDDYKGVSQLLAESKAENDRLRGALADMLTMADMRLEEVHGTEKFDRFHARIKAARAALDGGK